MSDGLNFMKTAAIMVLALAVIALMGNAIMDQWQYSVRDNTQLDDLQLTLLNNTAVATGYPYLKTINSCYNASDASQTITAANLAVTEGDRTNSYITLTATGADAWADNVTSNCSINYLASNSQVSAAITFETALTVFATFVGVIALAIIGKLVLMLYRRRED